MTQLQEGTAAKFLNMETESREEPPASTMTGKKPEVPPKPPKPAFKMPAIQEGLLVLWHPRKGHPEGSTAFVTKVYDNTIDLAILVPSAYNMEPKHTVYHNDDPNDVAIRNVGQGTWSFHPFYQMLEDLFGKMTATAEANTKTIAAMAGRIKKLEEAQKPSSQK